MTTKESARCETGAIQKGVASASITPPADILTTLVCCYCTPKLTAPNRMLRRLAKRRGLILGDQLVALHEGFCPRARLGGTVGS